VCTGLGFPAPKLDGGYQAFQATIQKASGRLYGALPFGNLDPNGLPRDALAYFVLTPSVNGAGVPSASVYKRSYLIPPVGYSLLYPEFGLHLAGDGALGFTITNVSQFKNGGFPSAGFMAWTGTGVQGPIQVPGPGVASDDGFTGCTPAGVGRWGDYGAAVVDATTGFVYTANENISGVRASVSNWGTFITQLH
jgi:hypothetical protein